MSNSALDAGIPVLTEIIDVPHAEAAVEPPLWLTEPTEAQPHKDTVDVSDVDGWLNAEWDRLERKIGGRILHEVMARLETDIEQRVRDALAEVLQVAVTDLAADIKHNLQATLQEAISQAVKQEVSRMQTAKS
jgi:hypothetical protein